MLTSNRAVFAVVAAGVVGLASAQSISSQCQATLADIVLSSDGQCLNAQALIGILMSGTNSSLVSPINSWLTGLCAQPSCTNDTLSTVTTNLTAGCQAELGDFGFGNATAPQLVSLVQTMYPTIREVVCLEDTTSNTLCITESLNSVQAANGPFTAATFTQLLQQLSGASMPNLPSSATCTDCSKQIFITLEQEFPGVMGSDAESSLNQMCGANFTDGQSPSDVRQTANGAVQSSNTSGSSGSDSKNGASPVFDISAFGVALSSLLAASSAFAFLG